MSNAFDQNAVVAYCAMEVERQHDGPLQVADMWRAWHHAFIRSRGSEHDPRPSVWDLSEMAHLIRPDKNPWAHPGLTYRRTPVTFNQITGPAPPAAEIVSGAVDRLWRHASDAEADELIKALLDIHPWADGNGRVASIARNWLMGTLLQPTPLPRYYP